MNDQDRFHHEVMSELEQEQWWEKNRRLLKGFEELRPVVEGSKTFEQYLKENQDGQIRD